MSPFFDRPEVENAPAGQLWNLLRQRGRRLLSSTLPASKYREKMESSFMPPSRCCGDAPRTIQCQHELSPVLWYQTVALFMQRESGSKDSRWSVYQIGSSNFTSAGTGISRAPNLEANLVYLIDSHREDKARKLLNATFPESAPVDLDVGIRWKPRTGEGEDDVGRKPFSQPASVTLRLIVTNNNTQPSDSHSIASRRTACRMGADHRR